MQKKYSIKTTKFDREIIEPCAKFPECYKVRYPNDTEAYCTCMDYSPEILEALMAKDGTECVICGNKGVTTRFVEKVGYNAWVCHKHKHKD